MAEHVEVSESSMVLYHCESNHCKDLAKVAVLGIGDNYDIEQDEIIVSDLLCGIVES